MNIDDIINMLSTLNKADRLRLQTALFELQCDFDLKEAIQENLADRKSGRVSAHEAVMNEIKASL
jgi:predicted transcriptional regulator